LRDHDDKFSNPSIDSIAFMGSGHREQACGDASIGIRRTREETLGTP